MKENNDFSVAFLVDNTPKEAFDAINNVRGWWSEEIEGDTDQPSAEFKYHYQDLHRCTIKITEFVPGKKVVWHVVDNYFDFVQAGRPNRSSLYARWARACLCVLRPLLKRMGHVYHSQFARPHDHRQRPAKPD